MGTEEGNSRGWLPRPPGESASRLELAPWPSPVPRRKLGRGCPPALRIQSLARSHGTWGAGGKPTEERRLLLREGTGRGFLGGRRPRFLPLERRRLALLAARKLASTEAGRRLTCVCQELEGREGDAGLGQGRERARALKHLALSSGAQGNLAPGASPSQGARSGRARPWRGVRCASSYRNMGTLKIHAMSPVHYV